MMANATKAARIVHSTEFKIEKGVPIPSLATPMRKSRYPFMRMEVGDSVFISGKKPGTVSGAMNYAAIKTGFKFKSRTVDGGVRVWRVS